MTVNRRRFLQLSGATAGALFLGPACSDDDPAGGGGTTTTTSTDRSGSSSPGGSSGGGGPRGPVVDADVPDQDTIAGWIEEVFDQGIRRPAYPADEWAEQWAVDMFEEIGLVDVRLEPITVRRWDPGTWQLVAVTSDGTERELDCFPLPYSAPASGVELELAAFDPDDPDVADRAALVDTPLFAIPADLLVTAGSAPDDVTDRVVDPDGTLTDAEHLVPFNTEFQAVMEPAIAAGAAVFIGALTDYPGDSFEYFVPYDAVDRPIPGVWIRGTDGAWLTEQLAQGPVRVRLDVASTVEDVESHNVVGELAGADDEVVMIGSHHDGPWASAVEDGSGIALVMAQATYWAAQAEADRPHRLVFVLHGGHMSGGAGLHAYIDAHREELAEVVLEVHLEHAALEFTDQDGEAVPTGLPVPRWFFTSRIPPLEASVVDALTAEELNRSMILAPDAFGAQPPTDGAFYHSEGVPIVNFLAAPFYLFDSMDTLDKVDREALVPLTRATIRIVHATGGTTATAMRDAAVDADT